MKTIALLIRLTEAQAWDFACFLKRVGFSDYQSNATSLEEAYRMRNAGHQILCALASQGYDP